MALLFLRQILAILCWTHLTWIQIAGQTEEEVVNALEFYEPGSDFCYGDDMGPLDMLFVVDRSSEMVINRMPEVALLAEKVAKYYKGSRFGITFYSDFQCSDWWDKECPKAVPEKSTNHHTDPEGCYTFGSGLSEDLSVITAKTKPGAITPLPSAHTKSALTALFLAASDPKVGLPVFNSTKLRRRVLAVVVSEDPPTLESKTYGTKNPPKGDGTDKCAAIDTPSAKLIVDKLEEKKVALFLVLRRDPTVGSKVKEAWSKLLRNEVKLPYTHVKLDDTVDIMFEEVQDYLKYYTYYDGKVPCVDPPGYNTLGL